MSKKVMRTETDTCSITVYSDGFALVKDSRQLPPIDKDGIVHFENVARWLEHDSIIVEGIEVEELEYAYDLVDERKLFEKYIGRQLLVRDSYSKADRPYTLLRMSGPLIMQDVETKEIVVNPKGELRFPNLEDDLHLIPTLVWKMSDQRKKEVCVSYLTDGVSWKADYVISLNGDSFDLSGWLTMSNYSGADFSDAKLRLISGKLNKAGNLTDEKSSELSSKKQNKTETYSNFHTYTFPNPVTLEDGQEKQLRLLSSNGSKARIIYEINVQTDNPDIYIEFDNTAENGLGYDLPEGIFKMYRTNPDDGSAEFIGEHRISHTEVGQKVRLKSGEACDIEVQSKKSGKYKEGGYEYTEYEYKICNTKEIPVEAMVRQEVPGHLWTVDESTHEWEKKRDKIILPVHVPVNQEETVKFTIRHERSARRSIGF